MTKLSVMPAPVTGAPSIAAEAEAAELASATGTTPA